MKKIFAMLTVLCLLCSTAALAENAAPFTFRNGISFGMTENEVLAAEGNVRFERDREHIRGGLMFDELEIEHIQENAHSADLHYFFLEGKLAAARIEFDDDWGLSYDEVLNELTSAYGAAAALDLNTLGNGIYLLDDDGRLGRRTDAFQAGNALIVLHQDGDDLEVGYFDLTASYLK